MQIIPATLFQTYSFLYFIILYLYLEADGTMQSDENLSASVAEKTNASVAS